MLTTTLWKCVNCEARGNDAFFCHPHSSKCNRCGNNAEAINAHIYDPSLVLFLCANCNVADDVQNFLGFPLFKAERLRPVCTHCGCFTNIHVASEYIDEWNAAYTAAKFRNEYELQGVEEGVEA